jgi:hypothetical protein
MQCRRRYREVLLVGLAHTNVDTWGVRGGHAEPHPPRPLRRRVTGRVRRARTCQSEPLLGRVNASAVLVAFCMERLDALVGGVGVTSDVAARTLSSPFW